MIEMTERSPLVDIDIKPSESFPLKVEIDWSTADWETHKDKVEGNFFKLGSPISNTIKYHSVLYK